jgi:dipeptidyl aminopeptidase/acylaminoacyl peptidase
MRGHGLNARQMLNWVIRCTAAVVLAVAPCTAAATADLIPRNLIFGNPERAAASLSPDGARIAFLAPVNGVLNVWVGPAANINAAKPVTRETVRPVKSFKWAQDDQHILFLQDDRGDENFHVFAVSLSTGKIKNLTNHKGVRAEIVAASDKRPTELLIGLNNRDPKWHDIWRVDIVTGKSVLVEKNDGYAGFIADKDLQLRLALKASPDGGMQVLRRATSGWEPFISIPAGDALTTYPLGLSGDGTVLNMVESTSRDKAAVVAVNMATGAKTVLGASPNADVAEIIADPVSNQILAFGAEYDRPEWTPIGPALKDDLAQLRKSIPGVWNLLSQSRDNSVWTLRIDNVDEPVKVVRYDRKPKKLTTLFVGRPALTGKPLARMQPLVIKARDGLNLVSYLTLPKGSDANGDGRPDKPIPMVLNVHGGPWYRDSFGYDPEHQWLANRGYAVLSVNFRGSTGFGKAFINAADREWAGKMHDDLIDAVNWAIKERIAPADKVAIYGGSYGGYAALVGLTFTPKTFACGVSIVGPSNLNTMLAAIPPYWESLRDIFRRRVGDHTTPEGQKLLAARSPLFKADKIERPLLIAQGANDPRVKQAESDQIVEAMKAKNIPVTYVLYADEGHGFARPENRMSFYAVSEAFLAKCLGGRYQPIGSDFQGSSIAVQTGKEVVPGLSEALGMTRPQ